MPKRWNSYEKGVWFLHMLRIKIGENIFWESIIAYYQKYKYALTDDFKNIIEQVTNKDLNLFFDQWLNNFGQHELDLQWKNMNDKVEISLSQLQKTKTIFKFPLDLQFHDKDGSNQINTIVINKKEQIFSFPISSTVVDIVMDPNIKLLY